MNAIEELLRATDPAAGAAPTPEPLQDERIAQILARDPALPVTPAPSDGRRNRSYLLLVALLAVLAVVASTAFSQRHQMHYLAGDRAEWADELLAKAANAVADPVVGPGQYLVLETIWVDADSLDGVADGESGVVMQTVFHDYYAPDGSGPTCFASGRSVKVGTYGPGPYPPNPPEISGSASCTLPEDSWAEQVVLRDLPTDPAEVGDFIQRHRDGMNGNTVTEQYFQFAARLLLTGQVTAEQRAAVLRFLIGVEGVEVTDPDVTIAGRNGIGIGLAGVEPAPPRYTPVDLLIDPASGEVLGVTYGYVPTEVDFGVVVTRSVLDELPADVISMACSTARNAEPGEPFICPEG